MKDRIKVQVFSFDQQYKPYQKEEFAKVGEIQYTITHIWLRARLHMYPSGNP